MHQTFKKHNLAKEKTALFSENQNSDLSASLSTSANTSELNSTQYQKSALENSEDSERANTSLILWLKIISLIVITLVAFETIAVATALPFIVEELKGTHMYALTSGIVMSTQLITTILAGPWCDTKGPKPIFYLGITFFLIGLILETSALNIEFLVLGRAIQGFGGGLLIVPFYVLIAKLIPPPQQPAIIGAFAAAWILPSLIGPLIAGFIVEHLSWRWVFGIPALFILFVLPIIIWKLNQLPNPIAETKNNSHFSKTLCLAIVSGISVGLLQIVSGIKSEYFNWLVFLFIVCCTIILFSAIRPLLPAHTFRISPGLPATIFYRGLGNGTYLTVELFLPLMLKNLHDYSAPEAGMVLTIGSITWALGSWIQGRIVKAEIRAMFPLIGSALQIIGTAITLLGIFSGISGIVVYIGWLIASFGIGLVYPALSVHALALTPPIEHGKTSSAIQVSDTLGAAVLIAFGGIIFALSAPFGYLAYLYTIGFALILIIFGLFITKRVGM